MKSAFQCGDYTVAIPKDCPSPKKFEAVVRDVILEHFGEAKRVAAYKDAWTSTQLVPEPFASNPRASELYRQALLALNPQAQAWAAFEEEVNSRFADYDEQGDDQEPAIPGWLPHWIAL